VEVDFDAVVHLSGGCQVHPAAPPHSPDPDVLTPSPQPAAAAGELP
jgi:hypothetical protein